MTSAFDAATPSVEAIGDGFDAAIEPASPPAITLVESTQPTHQAQAQQLLHTLLPFTGQAHRVGITGVPGVGKSTFIDTLGSNLTDRRAPSGRPRGRPRRRRAPVAASWATKDPDDSLANSDSAFIRPSPSAGTLGGVAKATRESMLVMEAAGL
ncbi:MAG: hypothetical protein WDN24_18730 [Sphingomonas sp.]